MASLTNSFAIVQPRSPGTPEEAGAPVKLNYNQFKLHDVNLVLKQNSDDDDAGDLVRYSWLQFLS